MSGAFAAAAAAIAADTNIATAATYTPAAARTGLSAITVRAVISRPTEGISGFGGFGGPGVTAPHAMAALLISALPYAAMRGDSLTVGSEAFGIETPEVDAERTTYFLPLNVA